jgi:hypothetical protein
MGRIVATPGVLAVVTELRLRECLRSHQYGDWGSVCPEDARENDLSVAQGFRILSCYAIDPTKPASGDNRLWVLTEADRSVTTVLLPSVY